MNALRGVFERTLPRFFAPVIPLLEHDGISEVMINGHDKIYVEDRGKVRLTSARFESEESLMAALRNLSQYVGRELSPQAPILEARLPDGSRVEAIIPPASPNGPMVSIRRFSEVQLSVEALVEAGSLTEPAADLLQRLVSSQRNIVVAGGAGSGKTSLLRALASFIGEHERLVVIEDATELLLPHAHVVQLEAQPAGSKSPGVSIRDLFQATLRMRPDRIVIGEIRGSEALELIQAMTSGHRGCLSTVHATYPIDTLTRLETMALMSDVAVPLSALRAQIASAIDVIVQASKLPSGARCVTHITEVVGHHPEQGYRLTDLFVRRLEHDPKGKPVSRLLPTGCDSTLLSHRSVITSGSAKRSAAESRHG